jgi:hypothetical protein
MAKAIKGRERSSPAIRTGKKVLGKRVLSSGAESWDVLSEDSRFRLTTSGFSARVMDEAVIVYGPALRRLADR